MCGPAEVGRTGMALACALSALITALALALLAPASATGAATLRVRALGNPPAEVQHAERFLVQVRVTRQGTGLRSAVLAYYLTPEPRVAAGAVRLSGRTSLASLQRRRQFVRRVRIGVPRSVSEGRYFLTACVVVFRGSGAVSRRPCRASQRRVRVVAAASPGDPTGGAGTDTTPTDTTPSDTTPSDTTPTDTTPTDTTPTDTTPAEMTPDGTGGPGGDAPGGDEPDDPTRIAIFPWVTSGGFDENWLQGLLFAALGLVGAAVLLFFSLGEFLPAMGGKAEYVARRAELDELVKQRDTQYTLREAYVRGEGSTTPEQAEAAAALAGDLESSIQHEQRELTHERNRLFGIGMAMYAVVGAAFAVLFAANELQALLIGFGWTAVAERFGLKREVEERGAERGDAIEELRKDAQRSADQAVKSEKRAEKTMEFALGVSEALSEEKEARKRAEQQLAAARGQSPPPQTPPQTPPPPAAPQPSESPEEPE